MDRAIVVPRSIPFHILQEITDGFSNDRKLGAGAYGIVYKGKPEDGETIAVKKLRSMPGLNDEQFKKEYLNIASLQHENIVRLVGYSHEIRNEWVEHEGKTVFAENQYMALCFEYMCNGSLADYLQDESSGEDWHTRYAIIKGICNGLRYLHEERRVNHLDLKPDNILLDEKMTPKIADFGLSKLYGDGQTRVSTSPIGTMGYLPPEYIKYHKISKKLDIFSLGVIMIKLMTGPDGYSLAADMSSEEFIELIHGKWRKRLQRTSNDVVDLYSEQVKTCIKLALSCVEDDRHKRPDIGDIVSELDHTETTAQFSHALTIKCGSTLVEKMSPCMSTKNELESELLNVHPFQLRFPFFEPNKSISCSLRLSNNTDVKVAFRVLPKLPEGYIDGLSKLSGIVPPRSTHTYLLFMKKQPPASLEEFYVTLESCIAHTDVEDDDHFLQDILDLTEGNKVHEETLMATICDPAGEKMTSKPIGPQTKIICDNIADYCYIVAMDTHPTEPWIVVGHYEGSISVWNYETQERVKEFRLHGGLVRTIIFNTRKQWIVAGDGYGQIHVRSCVTTDQVKNFQSHSTVVVALAVHPNLPLLLSASGDKNIKLWDWEKDWMCVRTFKNNPSFETIMFNPNNDSTSDITFTAVSAEGIAKIWKTSHPIPMATCDCKLNGEASCFDYLPLAGGGEHIVIGTQAGEAQIWDLKTKKCVQQITGLQTGHALNVGVVDCSPDRPLIVVALQDNTIGLYNPTTCRYENILMHKFGRIRRFSYIKAIKSVAIAHESGLAILEIH